MQQLKKLLFSALTVLASVAAFAQDTTVSTSTSTSTTETTTWYMQPWAWVAGGVLLLLIIILASRGGGSRKESVTVTNRTVRRDDTV